MLIGLRCRSARWLPWIAAALAALCCALPVQAQTYSVAATSYSWETVSTSSGLTQDDEATGAIALGFSFPFGTGTRTSAYLSTNGLISFDAADPAYTNQALPYGTGGYLFPFWDDLMASYGGTVTYGMLGTSPNRRFVVSWNNMAYYASTSRTTTFQAVLYESGNIKFQWAANNYGSASATIGFQASSTLYNAYSVNTLVPSAGTAILYTRTVPGPHHLEITSTSASALTCQPVTFTIRACSDAACTSAYTGGVTGTLAISGTGITTNYSSGADFAIAAGASSTTESAQMTTTGTATVALSGVSPAATSSPATYCGLGTTASSSASCAMAVASSGLLLSAPNHLSATSAALTVTAVRSSDNASVCVPAFTGTKSVTLSCQYQNPASGTQAAVIGGSSALNASGNAAAACDSGGRAVSLSFDATGKATSTVRYDDAGQLQLTARYTGTGSEAGLVMNGSTSFVAAPSSLQLVSPTSTPIRAGRAFTVNATAVNAVGATTPNYHSATTTGYSLASTLDVSRVSPTGSGAVTGALAGTAASFVNGVSSSTGLTYAEVGSITVSQALSSGSYLGSGYPVSGTSATIGRFIPDYFDLTATAGCGSFSYAGQPFAATITAFNAAGVRTRNYDGSALTTPTLAQALTLSDVNALTAGSLGSTAAVPASAFAAGIASRPAVAYSFTTKTTAPATIKLRGTDTDGVSSSTHAEPTMLLRSGRLVLTGAFGAELLSLNLPLQAQYWSGNSWVPNTADSCTTLATSAVARSNYRDQHGAAAGWTSAASAVTLVSGNGNVTLAAPSPSGSGTVDVALNLGATGTDLSCLASHPASTGANLAWLRMPNAACTGGGDRDPSAQAAFGITPAETRKTVHVRDLY